MGGGGGFGDSRNFRSAGKQKAQISRQISGRRRNEVNARVLVKFDKRKVIVGDMGWIGERDSFTTTIEKKIGRMPQMSTIRKDGFEIIRIRKGAGGMRRKYLAWGNWVGGGWWWWWGGNCARSPPSLTNRPNVSSANPSISLANMVQGSREFVPNRPLPLRYPKRLTAMAAIPHTPPP